MHQDSAHLRSQPDVRHPPGRTAALLGGAIVLLATLVFATFHAVPENTFHFDDAYNITENPATRIDTLSVDSLRDAALRSPLNRRWIPNASYAVDWWRGGGDPRPFLWTNLCLHALVAAVVFLLLYVVVSSAVDRSSRIGITAAFFGAAAWAVHPINVQAVTLIVQRMTQFACLFTVLSVLLYLLARNSPPLGVRALLFTGSLLALLCGAVSKENAWIAPLLVYLAELGVIRNRRPLFVAPLERIAVVGSAAAAALTFAVTITGKGPVYRLLESAYTIRDFTMVERVLTQPRVVLFHVSQIVWPVPGRFSLEHAFSTSRSLLDPAALGAILVVTAWCAAGVWLLRRPGWRTHGFFVLWVPIALLIESSVVGLEMVFEHRMYLPSVGLFGLAALAVASLLRTSPVTRIASCVVCCVVVLALALSTASYIPVWRTRMSLAQNSVRVSPGAARAWSDLGKEHAIAGSLDEAEAALRTALILDPDNQWACEYLGIVLMDRGRLDEAERLLWIAYRSDPSSPDVRNALGEVSFRRELYTRAEAFFRYSVGIRPWNENYRWNLALALEKQNRCSEALTHWEYYLTISTQPEGRRRVAEHIRENFLADSGSCFVREQEKHRAVTQAD